MANILIWGKMRDLMAGDLPPGTSTDEVHSVTALGAYLDGKGGALVLVDPTLLAAEETALQTWLNAGGSLQALLVAVVEPQDGDETLRRFPFLDDVLLRPVTPGLLRLRLERAVEAIQSRRVVRQLEEKLERKGKDLHELNNIGVALSAERDINKLLDLILLKSRRITAADAGSLYLVVRGKNHETQSDDLIRFELAQNDSVPVSFEAMTMPLNETSIAGYVALSGKPVNVPDCYELPPGYPFKRGAFDEKSGYRSKSMLVVPMRDHENKVIGVVQLINKKRDPEMVLRPVSLVDEAVIPFTPVDEELVSSLTSQAAVAYENTKLIKDIKRLFESFVRASVTTIEKRDPPTSGHSGRVAELTVALAERVDAATTGRFRDVRFTPDQIQEIRYASLLHDFGKVGVQEKYLRKAKKLYASHMLLVEQRFAYIQRTLEAEHLDAKMRHIEAGAPRTMIEQLDLAFQKRRAEIEEYLRKVRQANEPSILEDESVRAALHDLPKLTYRDWNGKEQPFLTSKEVECLSIGRGSLSAEERDRINEHVTHTYEFLKELPWTSEFRNIPVIAWAHHEKLDGTGYPQRLKEDQIPIQSKMMTVSDIYDALTAWDRPYKRSVPVERALAILRDEEAGRGKIDGDLLAIFIGAKVYEKTRDQTRRAGAEAELLR